MTAIRDWYAGFDLGAFLDVGLDTRQIGHFAAALFLVLFGLLALRRVHLASGALPALWIAIAAGLITGGASIFARGFPDQIPEDLRPLFDPDRLVRAAIIAGLLGCSLVFLSAHWVRSRWSRTGWRLVGLGAAALAIWLAAAWFADQLSDEARPWAARPMVTRGLTVAGLLILAGAFWFRPSGDPAPTQWANRTLAPPALALAVVLASHWFGPSVSTELPVDEITRVAVVLSVIVSGTCGFIATGAYYLRDRDRPKSKRKRKAKVRVSPSAPVRPLPVAVLLDANGRPMLPPGPAATPHSDKP
jgi:hypothetical protein